MSLDATTAPSSTTSTSTETTMNTRKSNPLIRDFVTADIRWRRASRALYRAEAHGRATERRRAAEQVTWTAREEARRAAGLPSM